MKFNPPSLEQYRNLMQAALEFRDLGCWKWMYDSDIFGVVDPESGQTGYCCVMGYLGDFPALGVYLGDVGLRTYFSIANENSVIMNIAAEQQSLIASFESRSDLEEEDLQPIKALGLKVRGKNQWPKFRSYRVGYFPWVIDPSEAEFLTVALQQAKEIGERMDSDPDALAGKTATDILVRVPEKKRGKIEWKDEWRQIDPGVVEEPIPDIVDEIAIAKAARVAERTDMEWDYDVDYAPTPINEDPRPYFPALGLLIDHHGGMIMNTGFSHCEHYWEAQRDALLSFIEDNKILPARINVSTIRSEKVVRPLAQGLNIPLYYVESLEMVDEAKEGLMNFMENGMF